MNTKHEDTTDFIHDLAAAGTFDLEQEIEVYKVAIASLMDQTNEADMAFVNMDLMDWLNSEDGQATVLVSQYDDYVDRLRRLINSQ